MSPCRGERADAPWASIARSFDGPVADRFALAAALATLAPLLAEQLQAHGVQAGSLRLKLALDDGATIEASTTLRAPAAEARLLILTLRQLLDGCTVDSGVVAVEVAAQNLLPQRGRQQPLFPSQPVAAATARQRAALATLAAELDPHGKSPLQRLVLHAPAALLPEERARLVPWEER
jgi:hypothetical protein